MSNINRVIISGHLTRDAELRATASGTDVLNFSMAVNESRKNPQTGQWEDVPNYVDCTMFGRRVNGLSKHLTKGSLACVEGRLHQSSWEREGVKRTKLEVIVDEIEFTSKGQKAEFETAPVYDDLPFS